MTYIYSKSSPYRMAARQESVVAKPSVASAELIRFDISPHLIMIVLMLVAALLGVLYLINFNQVATKGYVLKRLEISRQDLKSQHDVNNVYLANIKSISNMIEQDKFAGKREVGTVEYVFTDPFLAKAD